MRFEGNGPARSEFDGSVGKMDETGPDTSDAVTKVDETNRGNDGQTEERIGAPELTHSNGVGCAMRPRPAKRYESDPAQQAWREGASQSLPAIASVRSRMMTHLGAREGIDAGPELSEVSH